MATTKEQLREKLDELRKLTNEAERKLDDGSAYDRHRKYVSQKQFERTQATQDTGPIPVVVNPPRRERATESLAFFCSTYFPMAFTLPWSPYHFAAAAKVEKAVRDGGLFAFAMPRGSGKTTICEWAVLWAILTAQCSYDVLIGATEKAAEKRLRNLKIELQTNELLFDDWPEVCHPIRRLERSVRRAEGQKHNGVSTAIEWKKKQIVLPTVWLEPGEAFVPETATQPVLAPTSGSIIEVLGLTGEIRGLNHKREDGSIIRPTLAVCDDPQTRESAKSITQSGDREATISGDVAYLAGPGKPIAVVMPCTVVYQGDLADKMLDRKTHPDWQGERTKMVESMPANMKLWDEYREIQIRSLNNDGDGSEATEFYRENRAAMDAGSVVTWAERFDVNELSAIQHAMNKFFRDPVQFASEYQNDPIVHASEAPELSDEDIAAKKTAIPRWRIPIKANAITAFIDVQKEMLYYVVAAWEDHFTGQVVDYGAYPDQGMPYFSSASARKTLSAESDGAGMEGAIYAGLDKLTRELCSRKWIREDDTVMSLDRCLIDANWGQSTGVVYRLCANSAYSGVLLPAHGKYVGASSQPWSEYRPKRGEQIGHHWRLGPSQANTKIRRVLTDVNYWKSFVHDRLATAMGDHGCLSLFDGNHRMFSEHMNAEFRIRTKGRGREVDEWKQRPERPDNHLFDCMVGCCVGASIGGATLMGTMSEGTPATKKRRYKLSDLQNKKRGRA